MVRFCSCASAAAIFARTKLTKPAALLPTLTSATTCASFCPILFLSAHARSGASSDAPTGNGDKGKEGGAHVARPLMDLGYKMIFAVGSTDSVFVYDTGAQRPPAFPLPGVGKHYSLQYGC
jgi:hypothetical protein